MKRIPEACDSEHYLVSTCQAVLNYPSPPLGYLEVIGQRRAKGAGNSLGAPDALLHVGGQTLVIEFKRAKVGRLSSVQETARRLRAEHGVETHVIQHVGEFVDLVNACRRRDWEKDWEKAIVTSARKDEDHG